MKAEDVMTTRVITVTENQTKQEAARLLAGNMSLWLRSCGRYDRKSTESSNLAVLPHGHAALDLVSISLTCKLADPSYFQKSEFWNDGVSFEPSTQKKVVEKQEKTEAI